MPETTNQPTIEDVVRFHGHCCPGLALGFRVATLALERLRGSRADDEELVRDIRGRVAELCRQFPVPGDRGES